LTRRNTGSDAAHHFSVLRSNFGKILPEIGKFAAGTAECALLRWIATGRTPR